MKLYDAKTSFAAGELSPTMYGRVDLEQYRTGAKTIENFIVLPQGGLINRPGTEIPKFSNGAYFHYDAGRLVPFVYSEQDSSALLFSNHTLVIYRPGEELAQIGLWTPYGAEHLDKLRWLQSGDVLYLFHPDVPVHMLSRTASGWKIEQVPFEKGPFEDLNTDPDKKVRVTGSTLRSNFTMSGLMYIGQLIRIEAEVKAFSEELSIDGLNGAGFGPWVEVSRPVFGAFTYRTTGKWAGTLEVQRKKPDDTGWTDFKRYTCIDGTPENYSWSGAVEEYANKYRFRFKGYTSDHSSPLVVVFDFEGGLVNRVFRVNSFTATSATVTDVDDITEDVPETDAWAVGSFGPDYGYPAMGIFHQGRLVLANTKHSPQTIWMSQPASWHNFSTSIPAKDDDAITLTLASKEINEIRGLASRGDLLIFTAGGEWTAKAGSKSDVFTPSSIVVTPSGYRGSANIAPLDVGDVTLFVQRQGTAIRSIGYSLDVDGYASNDITILSEHMFRDNPVRAWAYQQTPWSVIWCVLTDGTIAALTLQREHKVNAWTRHILGTGKVTDVCCIPGTKQDEVYFAVEYDGTHYRVEMLKHRDNLNDSATFKDGGAVTIPAVMETLNWEANAGGTLQGRHKHIPVMTVRLLETKALDGGIMTENSEELDALPISGGFYTGDVRMHPPGGFGRTCRVRLESREAGPVCVLGIFPEVSVEPEVMRDGD